jgi:thymidylate kinase
VIYLQAPLNILSLRGDYGKERYERQEFQLKVKEQFDKMIESENFSVIRADQELD